MSTLLIAGIIFLLLGMEAGAVDSPCPPRRYFCWQVVAAANLFGEAALRDKAKRCGWTDIKIAEALKCLK